METGLYLVADRPTGCHAKYIPMILNWIHKQLNGTFLLAKNDDIFVVLYENDQKAVTLGEEIPSSQDMKYQICDIYFSDFFKRILSVRSSVRPSVCLSTGRCEEEWRTSEGG